MEIKSISREAGSRTKIAVLSRDENVDAVGACIGPKRSRIQAVVEELRGEKIDIIVYSEDPAEFIARALAPAKVVSVNIPDPELKECNVTVPNDQLSLAIGNRGQNAKLAAKLTGYKIDIKPELDISLKMPEAAVDSAAEPQENTGNKTDEAAQASDTAEQSDSAAE